MNYKTSASLIHQIASFETQNLNHQLKDLNLNSDQARTIYYISNHPNSMQREIAHYLHRQEASVTNLLKGLVRRGYVIRTIPSENERTKLLSLTEDGQTVVTQIEIAFSRLNDEIESPLSDAEVAKFIEYMNKIQSIITVE